MVAIQNNPSYQAMMHSTIGQNLIKDPQLQPQGRLEKFVAKAVFTPGSTQSESARKANQAGLIILAAIACLLTLGLAGIALKHFVKAYNDLQGRVNTATNAALAVFHEAAAAEKTAVEGFLLRAAGDLDAVKTERAIAWIGSVDGQRAVTALRAKLTPGAMTADDLLAILADATVAPHLAALQAAIDAVVEDEGDKSAPGAFAQFAARSLIVAEGMTEEVKGAIREALSTFFASEAGKALSAQFDTDVAARYLPEGKTFAGLTNEEFGHLAGEEGREAFTEALRPFMAVLLPLVGVPPEHVDAA